MSTPCDRRADLIVPAAAVLSFTLACVISSPRKFFRTDEMYSFYFLSDASFAHMMRALGDTVNAAPPVYFATGWVWAHLFGSSEVSLRLFSSAGISAGFVLVWLLLRPIYSGWTAGTGTALAFCLSQLIRNQNSDARFYGMLVAEVAAAALLCHWINTRGARTRLLVANAAVHATMIMTSYIAFFFSGAVLLAFALWDVAERRVSPKKYASVVAGWLVFVPWIPVFRAQSQLSSVRYWLAPAGLKGLLEVYDLELEFFGLALAAVMAIFLARLIAAGPRLAAEPAEAVDATRERSAIAIAIALLTVPAGVWIFSHLFTPIFLARYLCPIGVASAIVFTSIVSRFLPAPRTAGAGWTWLDLSHAALLAALVAVPVVAARRIPPQPRPWDGDAQLGHPELPIVVESLHDYLARNRYAARPDRYFYPLDREVAFTDAAGVNWGAPNEYQNMSGLARHYPFPNAVTTDAFLARHREFLVLESEGTFWSEMRVCNDPRYACSPIDAGGLKATLVRRAGG